MEHNINTSNRSHKSTRVNVLARMYEEIMLDDRRKLNWRAMNYFVRHGRWSDAAKCRDRVECWDNVGPL